jgi:hypothetical protein
MRYTSRPRNPNWCNSQRLNTLPALSNDMQKVIDKQYTFMVFSRVFVYTVSSELRGELSKCQSKSPAINRSSLRRFTLAPLQSRDEKPVTATPLESAFTNCDARNSFRMCIYENCRVSYFSSSRFALVCSSLKTISFIFMLLRIPLRFFAISEIANPFESIHYQLLAQNTGVWGSANVQTCQRSTICLLCFPIKLGKLKLRGYSFV